MQNRPAAILCLLVAAPATAQVTIETESNLAETPGNVLKRWDNIASFVADAGSSSQSLPNPTPPGSLVGHSSDRNGRFHVLVDRGVQPGPGRFTYNVFASEAAYRAGMVQETSSIDLVLVRDRALAFAIDPSGGFHVIVKQFETGTDFFVSWTDQAGFLAGSSRTAEPLSRIAAGCIRGRVCTIAGLSYDSSGRIHLLNGTETSNPGETLLTHFTFDNEADLISGQAVVTSVSFKPAIDSRAAGFDISLAAVPEPGSWAMMIGGFALAGAVLRRRARLLSPSAP